MKQENRKLAISQLNQKLNSIQSVRNFMLVPPNGWVKSIRKSLNISLKQLGKKLNVSSQNINQFELRETEGTITINKLRELGEAMELEFVYAFVPKDGSIKEIIEKKAYRLAKEIVNRTSHTMKLEDQENAPERIQKAIKEKTEDLINEMPRYLWD